MLTYNLFLLQVATNIAKLRKQRNISQEEMSKRLGFKSKSFYAHAEICANDKRFNLKHILQIAYILEVDIKELLP